MNSWRTGAFLILSALTSLACSSASGVCERVCEKSFDCREEDDGFRDRSDCIDRCEEMDELTADACDVEFKRLSKCYKRRFDCDGSHYDTCRRRQDELSTCLNAQEN